MWSQILGASPKIFAGSGDARDPPRIPGASRDKDRNRIGLSKSDRIGSDYRNRIEIGSDYRNRIEIENIVARTSRNKFPPKSLPSRGGSGVGWAGCGRAGLGVGGGGRGWGGALRGASVIRSWWRGFSMRWGVCTLDMAPEKKNKFACFPGFMRVSLGTTFLSHIWKKKTKRVLNGLRRPFSA